MKARHIRNLSPAELADRLEALGQPPWRVRQLTAWLYGRLVEDFDAMTDLPAALRAELARRFVVRTAREVARSESAVDGTCKVLFELPDGARVEAVRMRYDGRTTLCVSSQAGCPLDCAFCETARGGFRRNLTAGEILDQVCALMAEAGLAGRKVNVVFMGMGEPLLNFDAVVAAVRTLNAPEAFDLGARRITISTSSFPERIRALARTDLRCSLALSLNAPDDALRRRLMPKASRFPIAELLDAAEAFVRSGRRHATLEYVMLRGVNTSPRHADALARLAAGRPFKVNLIPYNPGRHGAFERVGEREIDAFARRLARRVRAVTVRRSRGVDIDAACGQLWAANRDRVADAAGDGGAAPTPGGEGPTSAGRA